MAGAILTVVAAVLVMVRGFWQRRVGILSLFLSVLFFSSPAAAQEPKTIKVREALRDDDGNYIPDRLGETVTLVGVLTSDPLVLSPAASLISLQDDTGGIVLFTRDTSLLTGHFNRGDLVEVRGRISQYKGQEQVVIEEIRRLGTRAVPSPRDILAADLRAERYEGQLVRVVGQLVVPPDRLDNNHGLVLRDRSGEIPLYVYPWLFNNPKFSERLMKGGSVELIGIAGQYKEQPPFDSGYRLVPRDPDDFRFAALPPYRAIALVMASLVFLGVTLCLWLRHRSSARRAREMAKLSESLKQSEAALRESENRLRAIIEAEPECVKVVASDGILMEMNPAGLAMVEVERADVVVGKSVYPFIAPENRHAFRVLTESVCKGNKGTLEYEMAGLKGTRRWMEVHAVPLRSKTGELSLLGVAREITKRKRAEEEIRLLQNITMAVSEAESLSASLGVVLRLVCDTTGWSLGQAWTPSHDGTVLECSPAWYHAVPILREFRTASERTVFHPGLDLPGRVWVSKAPTWIRDVTQDSNFPRAPFARGAGLKAGIGIPVLAGKEVVAVLEFFVFETRPEDERLLKLVSTVATQLGSVIRRKRAEGALREAEERYRSIVENAVEGIFQTTPEGGYLSVNPALARMYGYKSPKELMTGVTDIGRQVYVDPDRRAEFRGLIEEHGFVEGFEYQVYRKDGRKIWLSENARAVKDASGAVLYYEGTVEDVTERRALEDQLRQAQKMEAVGRLAGGVAHDFNNLLMVIKGHTELLRERLDRSDPQYRSIEQIEKAAERAASLTQQLLAYSRKQVIQPKVLDLNMVVAEMAKMLPRLLGEDIELVVVPNASLERVKADKGQIDQVIMNLAVNARDAMPHGGKLTIETANVYLSADYARQRIGAQPGSYVMLAVSDTGCGMDAETQSHIFEPFFTTKEKGQGTGLGLATVYGVVKQSGGYIWVYSEPGQGTSFKIYLPRVGEALEQAGAEEAPSGSLQGSETVLLVEDEEAVRELVCESLERNGYTVLQARDGAEAVQISRKHEGMIHLMITDVVMPGMSGRDLAHRLAPRHPKMKVLYMSGYTENAIVHHGVLDPGTPFLQKPFRPADVAHKVYELLDKHKGEITEPSSVPG
jgi:two-component system, cell cycle sensor histidine kinase and response regulator CckA